jgi:hypothetical protein
MAADDVVTKVTTVFTSPIIERALKTFVEVTAAQAALYTTVIPNSPSVQGSATISASATVLSIIWNGLVQWSLAVRSKKLDALCRAIDEAVDARLSAQAAQQAPLKPVPPSRPPVLGTD